MPTLSALDKACIEGDLSVVREEVQREVVGPEALQRAMMIAGEHGHAHLVRFFVEDMKVDPLAVDPQMGLCPLFFAAKEGRAAVVRFLVEEHRARDQQDLDDGRTGLMHAAESGHVDVVKCLVENNACEINLKDMDDKSAEDLARENGWAEVADFLSRHS